MLFFQDCYTEGFDQLSHWGAEGMVVDLKRVLSSIPCSYLIELDSQHAEIEQGFRIPGTNHTPFPE